MKIYEGLLNIFDLALGVSLLLDCQLVQLLELREASLHHGHDLLASEDLVIVRLAINVIEGIQGMCDQQELSGLACID